MSFDRKQLRQRLRKLRRALTEEQQARASHALAHVGADTSLLQTAHHIAFYSADDGEIDPHALLTQAQTQGKVCYLPVVRQDTLLFAPLGTAPRWRSNIFGIAEPVVNEADLVSALALDLIFVPLLGFDRMGHRLGRGGGYYDRCLAQVKNLSSPYLIGLAHAFQEVNTIPVASWDVPMQGILTEQAYIAIK